jgi:molybdopterin converting factor small subunit
MKIIVRSIALIKSLLGQGDIELELPGTTTVGELLDRLSTLGKPELAGYLAKPAQASAHASLRVMVNGRDMAALEDRATVLQDGDEVLIFIPIAGG